MKKILYFMGSAMLRKWLLAKTTSSHSAGESILPKPNMPYIGELAKRYLYLFSTGFLFTVFFAAGISMSIFSAAQSFDLVGALVPGAVFYSGLGLALISVIAISICYRAMLNTQIHTERLYLLNPAPVEPAMESPLDYLQLAAPFMKGLVSGWKKEKAKNAAKRSIRPDQPYADDFSTENFSSIESPLDPDSSIRVNSNFRAS